MLFAKSRLSQNSDPWFAGLDDGDPDGLAWFQREAVDAILTSLQTHRSCIAVMATGTGKTQVAGALINEWLKRGSVLFLAHRDELVAQARDRFEQMCGVICGVEQADSVSEFQDRVVVGSVQSVTQPGRLKRLAPNRFSLIITDECHHFCAKTFKRVLDHFDCPRVGVTATPDRTDKIGLGTLFEHVAYNFDILRGIQAGYLTKVRVNQVQIEQIDLSSVSKSQGDLAIGELDEAMRKAAEGMVKAMLELEPDRRALVFTPGVRTAEYMAARLNVLKPDSATFVSAETPYWERREIVRSFKRGEHQYFVNCQIATEGFDCPEVSMVVQCRPTMSRNLYAQMAGRACRAPAGVFGIHGKEGAAERRAFIAASSKPDCMILDMVGNSGKHDLVTMVDLLSSDYEPKVVQHAKKLQAAGSTEDVRKLLEQAKQQLLALAQKQAEARVKYSAKEIDPFKVCGVEISEDVKYGTRFGVRPATERQMNALRDMGVKQPDGMSKRAARAMLDRLAERRKRGLATLPQLGLLKKFGVDKPNLSKARASEIIDHIIRSKQQGRRLEVEHLNAMATRAREPGEEG